MALAVKITVYARQECARCGTSAVEAHTIPEAQYSHRVRDNVVQQVQLGFHTVRLSGAPGAAEVVLCTPCRDLLAQVMRPIEREEDD